MRVKYKYIEISSGGVAQFLPMQVLIPVEKVDYQNQPKTVSFLIWYGKATTQIISVEHDLR